MMTCLDIAVATAPISVPLTLLLVTISTELSAIKDELRKYNNRQESLHQAKEARRRVKVALKANKK